MRNEHFLPPLAVGPGVRERQSFMKLTTTKNLLGRHGQSCLLFGRLSTMPDGAYALEDSEGSVVLDLSQAVCFVPDADRGRRHLYRRRLYPGRRRVHAGRAPACVCDRPSA